MLTCCYSRRYSRRTALAFLPPVHPVRPCAQIPAQLRLQGLDVVDGFVVCLWLASLGFGSLWLATGAGLHTHVLRFATAPSSTTAVLRCAMVELPAAPGSITASFIEYLGLSS